ncbi:hypothetical protein V7S43_007922 [Phytophthora oleae]|uniref:Uncharacterized protein n=1 Tax=Phytophthora oleae TaxID=2107226 RepID=A0ABD3FJ80_9STRA
MFVLVRAVTNVRYPRSRSLSGVADPAINLALAPATNDVGNSVPLTCTNNKKVGYGYHRDGPNATGPTREFNIKNTRGYYMPSVAENGAITFREITLHPEYVPGNKLQQRGQHWKKIFSEYKTDEVRV